MKLRKGDQVALTALSNGLSLNMEESVQRLVLTLEEMGLKVMKSPYLFARDGAAGAPAKLRAENLMGFYCNEAIKAIFDISGGDIANEVLDELDYEVIKGQDKPFFGYSDLTTVINALYSQAERSSCLYQIRNIIGPFGRIQQAAVKDMLMEAESRIGNCIDEVKGKQIADSEREIKQRKELIDFSYDFLQGDKLEGTVIGGNIRCFLKLAGTKFMPDFKDKILLLESRSGGEAQMRTFLNQYKQMGAFEQVKGIILGSFTEMESKGIKPTIEELLMEVLDNKQLPVVKTEEIGHGADSKAIMIGEEIHLSL